MLNAENASTFVHAASGYSGSLDFNYLFTGMFMRDLNDTQCICSYCGETFAHNELFPTVMIRAKMVELIHEERPKWPADGMICHADLSKFRAMYVESMLAAERGELSTLEFDVLESLRQHETLAKNINEQFAQETTFGDRLFDRIATFGGSWTFLISLACVLAVWFTANSLLFIWRPFDPFPFIFLNLILSCLAAVQAPVIMMSQNRQESKDRLRGESDYRVNLKAELEIRHLHSKLDLLLTHQWQRLLEI